MNTKQFYNILKVIFTIFVVTLKNLLYYNVGVFCSNLFTRTIF